MKLDVFISHLRSILLKEGNLEIGAYEMISTGEEVPLEDKDIISRISSHEIHIFIGNLHLTK